VVFHDRNGSGERTFMRRFARRKVGADEKPVLTSAQDERTAASSLRWHSDCIWFDKLNQRCH
jgi:hypothetical protein